MALAGRQLGPAAGQGGAQGIPAACALHPGQERGLGAGDVQDDHVLERLRPSGKQARSAAMRSAACRADCSSLGVPQSARLGDGFPCAEMRPGTDAGGRGGEFILAGAEPVGFKDAGSPPEFLGRIGEGSCSDVVAADHEIAGIRQWQAREKRQLGDEPRPVGQASAIAQAPP